MLVTEGWTGQYLRPVEKVCKKYIVCAGAKWAIGRFNNKLGAKRWSRDTIRVATPEDIAKFKHVKSASYLQKMKWNLFPQATLDAVKEVLKEHGIPEGATDD